MLPNRAWLHLFFFFVWVFVITEAHETGQPHLHINFKVPGRPNYIKKVVVSQNEYKDAKLKFIRWKKELTVLEQELKVVNFVLQPKLQGFHNSVFRRPRKSARMKGEEAEASLVVSKAISKMKKLSNMDKTYGLSGVVVSDTSFSPLCFKKVHCDYYSKYRTIDGSCNNLHHPNWGQAETCFNRLLPPDYDDGLDAPRKKTKYGYLPSPRIVSQKVTTNVDRPHKKLTHMMMQWGQFLDHDMTFTPVTNHGFDVKCCPGNGTLPYNAPDPSRVRAHPACFPIEILPTDHFFKHHDIKCMEFVRSLAAPRRDCSLGYREQLNQITSYIDASNVYGSNEKEAKSLRETYDGRLAITVNGYRELLKSRKPDRECPGMPNKPCFSAGDDRVNEQPNLVIMHTLWLRQHNYLVEGLSRVNRHWDDEKLYQEARRIVGAQMQHITYNEWLRNVLGKRFMKYNKLLPKKRGYTHSYDSHLDASIVNEFSAAAFRFGHSTIQTDFHRYQKNRQRMKNKYIIKMFFDPSQLYDGDLFDELTRGLAEQSANSVDNSFEKDLTVKLFPDGKEFGLDLVSLNIQRGRDHGLPSYIKYREACGFGKVNDWKDLIGVIPYDTLKKLEKTYKTVEGIDLYVGGVSEIPKDGSFVGPTIRCILGTQFFKLKFGDRFYYENGEFSDSRFTWAQLKEIKKTRLSTIICDNSDDISQIQKHVFLKPSKWNKRYSCWNTKKFPRLNFWKWREENYDWWWWWW